MRAGLPRKRTGRIAMAVRLSAALSVQSPSDQPYTAPVRGPRGRPAQAAGPPGWLNEHRSSPAALPAPAAETYTAHGTPVPGGQVQPGLSDAVHRRHAPAASPRRLINAIR